MQTVTAHPRPVSRSCNRMLPGALRARLSRFIGIGVISTLAYALLFLALAGPLGSAVASAGALAVTAVANTAANRRITFGIRGREGLARQHLAGFVVFLIALALTNGALSVLHRLDPRPPRLLEAAVLVLATLAATVTRYIALATWVFRGRTSRRHRATVLPLPTEGD